MDKGHGVYPAGQPAAVGSSSAVALAVGTSPVADQHEFVAVNNLFNYKNRPVRDRAFTIAYCLLAAITVFWGIAAFTATDPNADAYTIAFFANSTTCDVENYVKVHPAAEMEMDMTFVKRFTKSISIWLPLSACVGIAFSVVYVLLFRRAAQFMVMFNVGASLTLSYVLAVVALATGGIPAGVILLIIAALMTWFYWSIRDQLKMCGRLLSVAGKGLQENLTLVPTAIGMKIAGVGILVYMFAALVCAAQVGEVRPMPNVRLSVLAEEEGVCRDFAGNRVDCCQWQVKGWSSVYMLFNTVTLSWTAALIMQIKLYATANVIAQWYFSVAHAGTPQRGSVRLALRHTLISSFGSISFASLILAAIRALRRALERASRQNIFCCILNCIAQPILEMLEQFTKFATVMTAITGDAFVPAAKSTFTLLKRNFLQTYSVWWIPEMVLHMAVFLFSLSWATLVFFAVAMQWRSDDNNRYGLAFASAAVCFGCFAYILHFVASLLIDIVDTVYICFALDRDTHHVTRPDVHEIYNAVPALCGPVIENPDGGIAYGAPDAAAGQHASNTVAGARVYEQQPLYAAPGGQRQMQAQPYSAAPYPAPYPQAAYGYPAVQPATGQPQSYGYGANNV